MFHYVFLDPQTINEASDAGEMGLGRLIELLNGFRRDVLIADTDAWRLDAEIREAVLKIPAQFQTERKQIQELLMSLKLSGPYVLLEGDDQSLSLIDFIRGQASHFNLDLILSPQSFEVPAKADWEKSNLSNFHCSKLALKRNGLMAGRNYKPSEKSFQQVSVECFSKLVRYADVVRILDYALGEYYSGDHAVNLKRFVRFLRDHAKHLKSLEIYTMSGAKKSIQSDVSYLQNEVDFKIEITFRQSKDELPHPRYLGADKRYLDIDRGIDLCDARDRCRLTQIKYASRPVVCISTM